MNERNLELAAYNGEKEKVIDILKTRPDINHRDDFGGTALHAAMFQHDSSIIILLLEYGLDPNAKGLQNGYTPLHDAVWAKNPEAVRILLENGSDPKIKSKDGFTAYEFAIKSGETKIAEYIKDFSGKHGKEYK